MLLLVDSGSTHSFVNSTFSARIGAETTSITPISVRVANGQRLSCNTMVPKLQWQVQGHQFSTAMWVLDLGVYDTVLGVDWLAQHSPMKCDWQQKTVQFEREGQTVHLTGVQSDEPPTLTALDAATLWQMHDANEIWGAALLEIQVNPASDSDGRQPPPMVIQKVLMEFNDVFAEPTELPPHRQYDHAITLEPGATPINCRPYRYSPLQKDEIERQVKEMLRTGVITHSMSPYAAPILLVKKKDGTWRFCVDYQRLNAVTIKNKFPLPIIDELLDELAGAAFFSKIDLRAGYHQIRMRESDEEKTAFKTHHGHFQFRVMPFGVTNGPPTFQCVINSIFAEPNRKFVISFLDYILVFSQSL
uniref:Reverse transcriptase domain-containing protein n=1 Tax=Triticum urartu TaxID=4572 RepID=A0A8R7V8C2_TRIUA